MCFIQDRLDLFFVPESRYTGLICLQNKNTGIWMVHNTTQVHQKFLIENILQRPCGFFKHRNFVIFITFILIHLDFNEDYYFRGQYLT